VTDLPATPTLGSFGKRALRSSIHPLLFAFFPALSLYLRNAGQLQAGMLTTPLSVLAGAVLAALALCLLLRLSPEKSALTLSAGILLFFFSGQFVDVYARMGWVSDRSETLTRIAVWVGSTLLAAFAVSRLRGAEITLTPIANRIGFVLILMLPVIHFAQFRQIFHSRAQVAVTDLPDVPQPVERIADNGNLPDIYVILLDEYGREDILLETYGHDNRGFLNELEARNFVVASHGNSNYPYTTMTFASMLNFDYVQNVIGKEGTMAEVMNSIANAPLFDVLEQAGYRVLTLTSPRLTFSNLFAEYEFHGTLGDRFGLNAFSRELLSITPFDADRIANLIWNDPDRRVSPEVAEIQANLDSLAEIAQFEEPTFVFLHIFTPHHPFLFERDGSPRARRLSLRGTGWQPDHLETFRRLYAEEVEGLNRRVLPAIDALLDASPTPPVIVILGDHGPRPQGYGVTWDKVNEYIFCHGELEHNLPVWLVPDDSFVDQWIGILHAAHFPGRSDALYETITPVNTIRLILSEYLGLDLPPLPDRSFFPRSTESSPHKPLEFREVTGEVAPEPSPTGTSVKTRPVAEMLPLQAPAPG
jgi:hypothetical protein